jgi:septum formation protein
MTDPATDLYLASGSPRRAELLQQIGVAFTRVSAPVAEVPHPGESPEDYVLRLARSKAQAGWQALPASTSPRAVLGADTLGVLAGQLLEKPTDQAHAAQLLRAMSGRTHQIMTAVAVTDGERLDTALVRTEVTFRVLHEAEIAAYWRTGEPADKAGGYAIQGLGAVFVERIVGSYSNVVGLPLETTAPLLNQYNVPLWGPRERGRDNNNSC